MKPDTSPKTSSPEAVPPTAVLTSELPEKGIHRIGNLVYTTRGLVALFAWLLWFDFCFTLMESVLGPIIQLRLLNELGMDANSYKFVLSTIPALLNFILNPIVSIKSDRYRSRFGRRIPFLLIGAPPVCACLALIGFGNEIAAWLQNTMFQGATLVTVTIWTFSILMLLFTLFNMLLGTTFYYLFNDVVPQQHLVKFMGYFRAAGTVAGMVYSYWIFPYSNKSGPARHRSGFLVLPRGKLLVSQADPARGSRVLRRRLYDRTAQGQGAGVSASRSTRRRHRDRAKDDIHHRNDHQGMLQPPVLRPVLHHDDCPLDELPDGRFHESPPAWRWAWI